ncbi:hypothetical protein MCUN1_000505 [Malassezia cuniculi]|uniref:sn-1-specific diacylglycerol lipase n=1 Tax=Malassezia cuniculi TaxID=948313 RepID=A0AAF0ES09_9BASI|nr:hypothetical protein MCUN1_000505 [Malassezia cuniculi]
MSDDPATGKLGDELPETLEKYVSVSAVMTRTGEIRYLHEGADSGLRSRKVPLRRMSDLVLKDEPLLGVDGKRSMSEHNTPMLGPLEAPTPSRQRAMHTGSAIEAISALLLQRNGAGRLDELSLRKSSSSTTPSLSLPLWIHTLGARRLIIYVVEATRKFFSSTSPKVQSAESSGARRREGLAWGETEDHETPPTPVAMPGAFAHDESDTLLLPPPLLDESSDPRSFEGILGVRRMRERQLRQQYIDQLKERNRPTYRRGALTAISNFVKAAKASEARKKPKLRRRRSTGISGNLFDMRYFRDNRGAGVQPQRRSTAPNSPGRKQSLPDECMARFDPSKENLSVLGEPRGRDTRETTSEGPRAMSDEGPGRATVADFALEGDFMLEAPSTRSSTGDAMQEPIPPSPPKPTEQAQQLVQEKIQAHTQAQVEGHGALHRKSPSESGTVRLTPLAMLNDFNSNITPQLEAQAPAPQPKSELESESEKKDEPPTTTLGAAWIGISVLFVTVAAIPDFAVFIMAHIIDFSFELYSGVANTLWFIRWTWMNLTGRTVLGRCIIEAYVLVQGEWAYVAKEDHEGRHERNKSLSFRRRRGLSAIQVIRGMLELICLQSVTREKFERENAGLELLTDWRDETNDTDDNDDDTDIYITNHSNDIVELSRSGKGSSDSRPYGMWNDEGPSFVRNLKWASRLAVSAYGLQVLIVDLPPVFTPSGRKFPQQTFAHLSRLDAIDVLHAEIQTMDDEEVYSPTFYIVRDMVRQVVCVAVRGTQSFADVIVDLDMLSEDVTDSLPEWSGIPRKNPHGELVYHAGIWRAAKALVAPGSTLAIKLKEALEEHPGFGLVFVGHSLGGAIASAAAILLSEYHLELEGSDPRRGVWRTHGNDGLPKGRRIRAITFANPSIVSEPLAKRISYGVVPLVTTLIFRHDILPRFGHGQVRELRRLLGALTRVRRRREMASTTVSKDPSHMEEKEDAVVHILSRFWDWRSICRTEKPDAVMLDRKRRIEDQFWRLRCEVEDDLFSSAKWRFDNAEELRMKTTVPEVHGAPLHKRTTRRQRLDAATLFSEAAQGGPLIPPGEVYWLSHGEIYRVRSPLAFFSVPDFQPNMFADHFPAAYEEAVLGLGTKK